MKWLKCCHCGELKDESLFFRDKHKPSGFKPRCKPCDLLSVNKSRRKAYEKEYWDGRREERRKQISASMEKHKEKYKSRRKVYLATPDGRAMYRRYTQTRSALRRRAFVEVVDPRSVYEEQGGVCYLCLCRSDFSDCHLDHVIPLSMGGRHERENTAIACATCNLSKGAKPLWEVFHQMV